MSPRTPKHASTDHLNRFLSFLEQYRSLVAQIDWPVGGDTFIPARTYKALKHLYRQIQDCARVHGISSDDFKRNTDNDLNSPLALELAELSDEHRKILFQMFETNNRTGFVRNVLSAFFPDRPAFERSKHQEEGLDTGGASDTRSEKLLQGGSAQDRSHGEKCESESDKREHDIQAAAFARFLASDGAWQLATQGATDQILDDPSVRRALDDFFHHTFGVDFTKNIARSVRVEWLAQAMAYAQTTASIADRDVLADMRDRGASDDAMSEFLMQCIQRDCVQVRYSKTIDAGAGLHTIVMYNVRVDPTKQDVISGRTAPAHQVDAAAADAQARRLLLCGASARQDIHRNQLSQIVERLQAVDLLTGRSTVGTPPQPNSYNGWDISNVQMVLSPFSVSALAETGRGPFQEVAKALLGPIGRMSVEQRKESLTTVAFALTHLATLAEAAAGETGQGAEAGRALLRTNVHVIGCDTLGFDRRRRAAQRDVAHGSNPRAGSELFLKAISDTVALIAHPTADLTLRTGTVSGLTDLIQVSLAAMDGLFQAFPTDGPRVSGQGDNPIGDELGLSHKEMDMLGQLIKNWRTVQRKILDQRGLPEANALAARLDITLKKFGIDIDEAGHEAIREGIPGFSSWSDERQRAHLETYNRNRFVRHVRQVVSTSAADTGRCSITLSPHTEPSLAPSANGDGNDLAPDKNTLTGRWKRRSP